ncbi:hypothetical protein [Sphingomonas sp. 1P08PE]|uniref:hypothetical protein n=1 Tax=Sphingomonas sp. 1P08PE TaxID=554122 RepID=UPI0039A18164
MPRRGAADLPLVVTYEDRKSAIPGIELLARSLAYHAPKMRMRVYTPLEEVSDLAAELDNLEVSLTAELVGRGWDVKPTVMLWGLADSASVLWFDTDVVVAGDLTGALEGLAPDSIVVGQEFRGIKAEGGRLRAEGWGFEVGNLVPHHVNSGSVRVTSTHRALLQAWRAALETQAYRTAQTQPLDQRAIHLLGDQDVLWALIASKQYSHLQVQYFRAGKEMIVHCGANGYHALERLGHVFGAGRVAFIHMLGGYKPWSFDEVPDRQTERQKYLQMIFFELSLFHAVSVRYAAAMGNPRWLTRRTRMARVFNMLAFGNVALRGLPLALMAWARER